MTAFVFTETVPNDDVVSAALGVSANAKFASADLGKAVKLSTAQNYVPVAADDEIEGFVVAVEPFTVNDGFSFGSVQYGGRIKAQSTGTIAIGGLVVAAAPVALGTAGYAQVKAGSPTKYLWRMVGNITSPGNSAANTHVVLLERLI